MKGKLLPLISCLFAIACLAACSSTPATGADDAAGSGSVSAGLSVAQSSCQFCHTLPLPIHASDSTQTEMQTWLPGHAGLTLTDQQVLDLSAYLSSDGTVTAQ